MAEYKVNSGQNILDVCLEQTGGFDNLIQLLNANELGLNDALNTGQIINIPEALVQNNDVVSFFSDNRINTGETDVFKQIEDLQFLATIYLRNTDA